MEQNELVKKMKRKRVRKYALIALVCVIAVSTIVGLRKENKNLFPTESAIKDSAIYKASPLHKLTKEQEKARELIIQKVSEALEKEETKQLIFIDGEAGTGKTVLTSSTFYELYCQAEESNKA